VAGSLQGGDAIQSLVALATPERLLSTRDPVIARVIASQQARWPSRPTEDPIWGLVRIVMAQQISTGLACRLAEDLKSAHPTLTTRLPVTLPDMNSLRALGLPQSRAQCCVTILQRSAEIRASVEGGQPWERALAGIKGIGPWTLSTFRIMVLRAPDELPSGDVGLKRAVASVYGADTSPERLGELWRPFRSVACWYLWRTLGNEQLG